jgi:hypothetical protein
LAEEASDGVDTSDELRHENASTMAATNNQVEILGGFSLEDENTVRAEEDLIIEKGTNNNKLVESCIESLGAAMARELGETDECVVPPNPEDHLGFSLPMPQIHLDNSVVSIDWSLQPGDSITLGN